MSQVDSPLFDEDFVFIAGPCAIESREQFKRIATALSTQGVRDIRGGAFMPRRSPDSFQGLGREGLLVGSQVTKPLGRSFVSEILDPRDVPFALKRVDLVQVGARSMQNYALLRELSWLGLPVLLKRGAGATWAEVEGALEHLRWETPSLEVLVCERGIRTFEPSLRYTLDLAGALAFKARTGERVLVDPSHATGDPSLVRSLVRAAYVAGLDGAIVEVHDRPSDARCDGQQAISVEEVARILSDLSTLREARSWRAPPS